MDIFAGTTLGNGLHTTHLYLTTDLDRPSIQEMAIRCQLLGYPSNSRTARLSVPDIFAKISDRIVELQMLGISHAQMGCYVLNVATIANDLHLLRTESLPVSTIVTIIVFKQVLSEMILIK